MWVGAVDGASNGLGSAEDFSDGAGEISGARSWSHDSSAVDDVVHGDVTVVLDWEWTVSGEKRMEGDLLFLTFFLSRRGSLRALMIIEEAEGTTET